MRDDERDAEGKREHGEGVREQQRGTSCDADGGEEEYGSLGLID